MSFKHAITFDPAMLSCGRIILQQFLAEALSCGLPEVREYYMESEAPMKDAVAAARKDCVVEQAIHYHDMRNLDEEKYYFNNGDTLVYISHYASYNFSIYVAATTAEKADAMTTSIVKVLPKIKHTDPDVVPVSFWAMTRVGVTNRTRKIAAPTWEEIAGNYTRTARRGLDTVMNLTPPLDAGKLLLWHGLPGTGKSYGIRALMREWRKWCTAHYIVDPERFFGEADYMLSVILDQTDDDEPVCASGDPKAPIEDKRPWHLLVMEDSDEFLQADAKDRQGQSLSRLLNMADGLIGQGLNLLVLITTNEPLAKIHPAIKREGRCLANIEFGRLSVDEVDVWRQAHGLPVSAKTKEDRVLLSDLYAKVRAQSQVKTASDKQRMGLVR